LTYIKMFLQFKQLLMELKTTSYQYKGDCSQQTPSILIKRKNSNDWNEEHFHSSCYHQKKLDEITLCIAVFPRCIGQEH
jgi:hypothetical protein